MTSPLATNRLLTLAILVSLIAAAATIRFDRMRSTCPFFNLTGVPCPLCKMTSAWSLTLHGELRAGAATNPLGVIILLGVVMTAVYLVFALVRQRPPLRGATFLSNHRWPIVLILTLWLANWVYVAWRLL